MAKDIETDKGKDSILPPPPRKSFLDRASNKLARTIAQIRTGHWLCGPYLKRIRKDHNELVVWTMEDVSDPCVPLMYASHVGKSQDRHLGPPR
jgi:hypothetical protein